MFFPRKLKSKSRMKDLEMTGEKVEHSTHKSAGQTFIQEVKDFGKTIWRLLRNPIYITIALSSVISVIGLSGMLSFMPKYLVIQYTIPLWKSNIIIAISTIAALAMGSFLGGLVSRRVEMTPRTSLKLLLIFDFINLICMSTGFFLGCDQPTLVGDNGHGRKLNSLYSPIEPSCKLGCSCDDGAYFPACGEDGRTYFSPCHAGCTEQIAQSFFNCTCINSGKATPGLCDQGCSSKLYIYSAITFIGRFVDAFKIIPIIIVKLRCVEERDRASASAFSGFLSSALGWMPGPVIFGAIVDGTCSLWKYTCGERQSCLLYDIILFRKVIHGYGTIATALSIFTVFLLYIYLRVKGITQWREHDKKADKDNKLVDHFGERDEGVQE